jgi:hypothetical protein
MGAAAALPVTRVPDRPECDPNWVVVPSPNVGTSHNFLRGVACLSDTDCWSVGSYAAGQVDQTLIQHWNGSVWSVVASPNAGSSDILFAVAAISSSDVWAVGGYYGSPEQTLVEHWNGTAWSIVTSPSPGTGNNSLYGVAEIASNDVWAVGYYYGGAGSQTLIEHWNGSAWSIMSSPSPGTIANPLWGVAAIASNDVWAVGYYAGGAVGQTLAEHWDGSTWSVVSTPSPGTNNNGLWAVTAVGSGDVWAVGSYGNTSASQTLVEHWNGSTWSVVSSPNTGSTDILYGVDAAAGNDASAIGDYVNGPRTQTLVEHWDGSTWSIVSSPDVGSNNNELVAIAMISGSDVWGVGDYTNDSGASQTLAERYNPCVGSPTPTPTSAGTSPTATATHSATPTRTSTPLPTQTPGGSTATPSNTNTAIAPSPTAPPTHTMTATNTPGTPTATTTATSCPIQFTDVPPGSTFYSYIHCLACLGIINGYPDGSFKPNASVNRGQLSKIVSNSAGFNDPQPTRMFQDVPLGSTFQVFIGRLASRGYINGYPCSGAGEPCVPPGNLPYFRPNNNATRGQISKIDSNAAGFSGPPSGQQFEDVPVGSTYYTYTYRLVSRGVMSGYQCGGANEPCVPPGNLPYFRPNNNATRGQTSKIVANTFFPDCQAP